MRLSLVYPAWFRGFGPFSRAATRVATFPPLNLCTVGAIAEREGWEVRIVDAHIEELEAPRVLDRILSFRPDLVGLTGTTPFFGEAVSCARALKERAPLPVMVGGPHVSILREAAFEECFDYLFIGECERNLPGFLRSFGSGDRNPAVPGVLMRKDGAVVFHGEAAPLEDLGEAPLPARHLLPVERYLMGTPAGRKRYTSVQMSRGCPFSCVFCASDLHGKRVRRRRVESVLDELEGVVRDLGVEHVCFADDTLTLDRRFILDLCAGIEARGLSFTFEGNTRANLWDEEIAGRLRSAGLVRISFGLESADPGVRSIIRNELPRDACDKAMLISRRLGIETINSVVLGLPGDTRESIGRTVDFISRSRDLLHVSLNTAIPYPGTEMWRMAEEGRHGLRIVERDLSQYLRYGSAVMEVNGISPAELVAIQRKALLRFHSRWWRIVPALRRFGPSVLLGTLKGVLSAALGDLLGRGKAGRPAPARAPGWDFPEKGGRNP